MKSTNIRRVKSAVCDAEARKRLEEYRKSHGPGPHRAAILAYVIWTDALWRTSQGAGAAASRVLKRLGCYWTERAGNWGWMISLPQTNQDRLKRQGLIFNHSGKCGKIIL